MNYKKTKLSLISNTLFLSISILLLTFVWVNFYTHNLSLSLFLGLMFTIIFTIMFIIFTKKKLDKENSIKSNKLNYEETKNHFLFSSYNNISQLLVKLYKLNNIKYINNYHYTSHNCDIYLFFEDETLDNKYLIKLLKEHNHNKILIFCFNYKIDLEIENIVIEFINIDNIINKLKEEKIEIDNLLKIKPKQKVNLNLILNISLNKEKSKTYFIFGLFMIFSSLFSPFTVYYIISGTLLIILSIYSRFNNRFNN